MPRIVARAIRFVSQALPAFWRKHHAQSRDVVVETFDLGKHQGRVAQRILSHHASTLCMDPMHRPYAWTLCIDLMHGPYASTLCMDPMHRPYAWTLCIDLMHGPYASTLCMDLGSG